MVKKQTATKKSVKPVYVKNSAYLAIVAGIVLLVAIFGIVIYAAVQNTDQKVQDQIVLEQTNADRKARIEAIYAKLKLNADYTLQKSDVFGDKRVYDWDNQRSYSSSKTYEHNAPVDKTVAETRKAIEAAGFSFIDEPYPGSTSTQFHFKSADKEYIRLTVSSKSYDEATQGKDLSLEERNKLDPNAAPSTVLIKVNLDDNNE